MTPGDRDQGRLFPAGAGELPGQGFLALEITCEWCGGGRATCRCPGAAPQFTPCAWWDGVTSYVDADLGVELVVRPEGNWWVWQAYQGSQPSGLLESLFRLDGGPFGTEGGARLAALHWLGKTRGYRGLEVRW